MAAQGTSIRSLAKQFGVPYDALFRHNRKHISAQFRASVIAGPFASEERLRQLAADAGTSVLDNLRSVYSALAARYLVAFESGADVTLGMLSGRLHDNLTLQAKLTKELMPAPNTVVQTVFHLPIFGSLQNTLLRVLADHPAARAAVIAEFKKLADGAPPLIEVQKHDAA